MKIPIFIINLLRDKKRRNNMIDECRLNHLEYEFIDAVDGIETDLTKIKEYNDEKCNKYFSRSLKNGEIGCLLSHKKIYEKIILENLPYALILEDDIKIESELNHFIASLNLLPSDWELVLLGHYAGHDFNNMALEIPSSSSFWHRKKLFNHYTLVRLSRQSYGAHGYLISYKGAEKLLKELESFYMPIDHYTGNDKFINLYAIEPVLIKLNLEDSSNSSIGNRENNKDKFFVIKIFLKKIGLLGIIRNIKRLPSRLKYRSPY